MFRGDLLMMIVAALFCILKTKQFLIILHISGGGKLDAYKDKVKYHQIVDLDRLNEREFDLCLVFYYNFSLNPLLIQLLSQFSLLWIAASLKFALEASFLLNCICYLKSL